MPSVLSNKESFSGREPVINGCGVCMVKLRQNVVVMLGDFWMEFMTEITMGCRLPQSQRTLWNAVMWRFGGRDALILRC